MSKMFNPGMVMLSGNIGTRPSTTWGPDEGEDGKVDAFPDLWDPEEDVYYSYDQDGEYGAGYYGWCDSHEEDHFYPERQAGWLEY